MDGYTQFSLQDQGELIDKLADGINTLYENQQWPVFIALYDEFWVLKQSISAIVSAALDTQIEMLPAIWAWRVDASSAGWGPHRDQIINTIREDGTPNSLTAWVALNDATPDNGCIYVLPASEDIQFPNNITMQGDTIISDWQTIRALPVSAGTCLVWNQNILHWGGKGSRRAEHPRISIAIEYQRADIPAYNEPLFDPFVIPDFTTRLAFVSKQILQYKHMYAVSDEMKSAAEYFLMGGLSTQN
jgi:ectoine hydroxylase-related dioxygenase (phytanoyl-CoA dioxygenase family)